MSEIILKNKITSNTVIEGITLAAIFFLISFITGAIFGEVSISPTNIQPPLYYILAINLGCCLLTLLSGLLLGIPSTAFLLFNGYMFGTKIKSALIVLGLGEVVMRIFPHLFIEIIAMVLAASVGTTVAIGFIKRKEVNRNSLVFIAVLAVVTTVLSCFIEVYVTNKTVILSEVI